MIPVRSRCAIRFSYKGDPAQMRLRFQVLQAPVLGHCRNHLTISTRSVTRACLKAEFKSYRLVGISALGQKWTLRRARRPIHSRDRRVLTNEMTNDWSWSARQSTALVVAVIVLALPRMSVAAFRFMAIRISRDDTASFLGDYRRSRIDR